MKRSTVLSLWTVSAALMFLLVLAASRESVAWWVEHRRPPQDPLEWIQREFHPGAGTLSALRAVHETYAAARSEAAQRIQRQREQLLAVAATESAESRAFRSEADRWDRLVAESHALTWRYIFEMARQLPAAEAQRFRVEMARMVLGGVPVPATATLAEASR